MITLRKALLTDSAMLFAWRNDPETVRACATSKPVTEAEHDRWLIRVLSDASWHLYIAELERALGPVTVGMGRLQGVEPKQAVVSYSVAAPFREHGYAGEIVAALCAQAFMLGYTSLRADARRENTASIRALLSHGFEFSPVEMLTLERRLP